MDFSRLSNLATPEGEVREIEIDGVSVWRRGYGVRIITSNDSAITDFLLNTSASKTFTASIRVPPEQEDSEVVWNFTDLPEGLSASGSTVSGTATTLGDWTVTVTVTKGDYSDTKTYTFTTYCLEISTTSLPQGTRNSSYSTTLGVNKNLPSGVGNLVYTVSGLPSGLSANSSTGLISGTPTAAGTSTVSVYATQCPYISATKKLSLKVNYPTVSGFDTSRTTLNIPIAKVRSAYKDTIIATFYVNGWGLANSSPYDVVFSLSGCTWYEFILEGSSNSAVAPKVQLIITVVDATKVKVDVKLTKNTTVSETVLRNRGITSAAMRVNYADADFNKDYAINHHIIDIKMV